MRRRLCKQWVWSQETLAMLSGGYKRLEKSICLHRLSRKSNKYQMSAHVEFYRTKLGFNQSSQNQSPQTMDHVFHWYVSVINCKRGIGADDDNDDNSADVSWSSVGEYLIWWPTNQANQPTNQPSRPSHKKPTIWSEASPAPLSSPRVKIVQLRKCALSSVAAQCKERQELLRRARKCKVQKQRRARKELRWSSSQTWPPTSRS